MENEKVNKVDLFQYTFFDNSGKLNVVLNVEYIKKLFDADIVLLEETEHK